MTQTKNVQHGDVQLTVRESNGWDRLHTDIIFTKLNEALPQPISWVENNYRRLFARCCRQTLFVKGIALGNSSDEPQALAEAFNAWMELPGGLQDAWIDAIRNIDEAPGPKELRPPDQLSENEKADPK